MLSPVLFIALVGAIWSDPGAMRYAKLAVGLYLATQFGFGAYRTYAAVVGAYGLHYAAPFPIESFHKGLYFWNYDRLRGALRDCARVSIDIDDLYLESFVKMVATDIEKSWSSVRPVWGYDRNGNSGIQRQVEDPDCLVSTQTSGNVADGPNLIWLRRDRRMLDFTDQDGDPCIAWVFGVDNDFKFFHRDARIVGEMKLRVPVGPRPCLFDGNPTRL